MSREDLAPVLWDIPVNQQSALTESFLIRRVLQYGGMSLLVASLRQYGKDVIQSEFASMKASSFEARRYHYLKYFWLA